MGHEKGGKYAYATDVQQVYTVPRAAFWFGVLLMSHTTLLLLADLTGAKLIELPYLGLVASVGFVTYGFSVVVLLIIRELFGSQRAKQVVLIGFIALIVSTILVTVALAVPPASFWAFQSDYENTLGRLWRLVTFGYLSYFVAQNLEVLVFNALSKLEWLYRPVRGFISAGSTQFLETVFFMTAVFWGTVPSMSALILGQFTLKILLLCVSVPTAYLLVHLIRRTLEART